MEVRCAQKDDVDSISDLEKKLLDFHLRFDDDIYRTSINSKDSFSNWLYKKLDDNDFVAFVCLADNNIIGYITGWIEQRPKIYTINKFGYLSNIFVEDKYRGTRAARYLVENLFSWFREKNVRYVTTSSNERNLNTVKFFHEMGFKDFTKTMLKTLY